MTCKDCIHYKACDDSYSLGNEKDIDKSCLEFKDKSHFIELRREDGRGGNRMKKLKPCPFCGGKAEIVVCDDEGNLHDEEYEKDAWSGLGYKIIHSHEENEGCPIARYEEDEARMGVYIYDTRAEAIEAWNRRVENEKEREALTEIKELIDKHWGVDPIYYTDSENTEEAEAARLCCCINEIINSVEDSQTF